MSGGAAFAMAAAAAGANSGPAISLEDLTVTRLALAPATASYALNSNGQVVYSGRLGTEYWIVPQSGMSGYEAKASLVSGLLTSGTTGSWLPLSTTRTWTLRSDGDIEQAVFDVEIRKIGTSTVLATARITMEAEGL